MHSPAAIGSLCVGIRCPAWSISSPWAVSDTVSAPGSRDPITACAAGGLQLFAVSQTFPGERHIELRPVAVVGIAALVRALWKVGHIVGGYQEAGGARACYPAPLCQAVLAVVTIHLAEVAVGHIIHDGVKVPATAGGCGITLSCRIGRAPDQAGEASGSRAVRPQHRRACRPTTAFSPATPHRGLRSASGSAYGTT